MRNFFKGKPVVNEIASIDIIPSKVFIYEGELDYISRCILDFPDIETGGNLFGHYTNNGIAVIEYVIGPGKASLHHTTKFQQEEKYIKDIYDYIFDAFAMCEIGAWHSHHQLDLPYPSGGDVAAVHNGFKTIKNEEYLLVIGNFTPPKTPINAFVFKNNSKKTFQSAQWNILEGMSPFRNQIDKVKKEVLIHPITIKGCHAKTNNDNNVFKKQHWLLENNNAKELNNIVNFIKQKTENVKIFYHDNEAIVIVIRFSDQVVNIIFPNTFPSGSTYLIRIESNEGELINEIKDYMDISKGISMSIIESKNINNLIINKI